MWLALEIQQKHYRTNPNDDPANLSFHSSRLRTFSRDHLRWIVLYHFSVVYTLWLYYMSFCLDLICPSDVLNNLPNLASFYSISPLTHMLCLIIKTYNLLAVLYVYIKFITVR